MVRQAVRDGHAKEFRRSLEFRGMACVSEAAAIDSPTRPGLVESYRVHCVRIACVGQGCGSRVMSDVRHLAGDE